MDTRRYRLDLERLHNSVYALPNELRDQLLVAAKNYAFQRSCMPSRRTVVDGNLLVCAEDPLRLDEECELW